MPCPGSGFAYCVGDAKLENDQVDDVSKPVCRSVAFGGASSEVKAQRIKSYLPSRDSYKPAVFRVNKIGVEPEPEPADHTGRPTDIKRIDVWISYRADVDGINPELNLNFGLSYWQTSSGLSLADINGQNLECPSPSVLRLSHGRILTVIERPI
ncbi:hypothetical protein B0H13DRAFT_1883422 [Mycena leptocephala]|nr:hypothetical protein B0H13DRAFT_1883422 [Mycena leptocephala]